MKYVIAGEDSFEPAHSGGVVHVADMGDWAFLATVERDDSVALAAISARQAADLATWLADYARSHGHWPNTVT